MKNVKVIAALALGLLIGSAGTALAATSDTVQAVFAEFNFLINGEEKTTQTAPLVVDGTSYLQVREIAGLLGAEVDYDDATRTIILDTETTPDATVDVPTSNSKTEGDNVNTSISGTEEWITLEDLVTGYGLSLSSGVGGITLKNGDASVEFPYPEKGSILTSETGIRVTQDNTGATLLGKEIIAALGLQ